MKKLLLTAAAVLLSLSVHAQGRVNFQNSSVTSPIRNANTGGALVTSGEGIRVALYWAPLSTPNQFTLLGTFATVGGPVPPIPGQFIGGVRTTGTQTMPGQDAMFIVKAWEAAYGASYEIASVAGPMGGRGALLGESPAFRLSTPGSDLLPAASLEGTTLVPGFRGLTVAVVPEPSIIALGLIGAGSLLLFRRRK